MFKNCTFSNSKHPLGGQIAALLDAPPSEYKNVGISVFNHRFISALGGYLAVVFTRQDQRWMQKWRIRKNTTTPIVFYPDFAWLGLRGIAPMLRAFFDCLLFLFCLPWLIWKLKKYNVERIFAVCGGDGWFLLNVLGLRLFSAKPVDIYLVDDLEESFRNNGHFILATLFPTIEKFILNKLDRVFVISPGYVEHLASKYGIKSEWLPILVPGIGNVAKPVKIVSDLRYIGYLGSLNYLYLSTLIGLIGEIGKWNSGIDVPFQLRLKVFTIGSARKLLDQLEDSSCVEVVLNLPADELVIALQECWTLLLPYSFDEKHKVMVSTSFSHKFTEYIQTGRPILAVGPAYASIPELMKEHGIPFAINNIEDFDKVILEIEGCDLTILFSKYQNYLKDYHLSPVILSKIA